MKKLISLFVGLFMMFTSYGQDSYGTDFWLAVPGGHSSPVAELYITAQAASTVTVSIPGLAYTNTFAVAANTLSTLILPSGVQISSSGASNRGIHVTATTDVTVYLMNQEQATTDAYMALPVDALGLEYYVMTYMQNIGYPGRLTIVATENNTTVTINPKIANSAFLPIGVNSTVTLNEGQTYQLNSTTNGASGDFTGSVVSADKPIAVFGAVQCVNIPTGVYACDYIVEQMPPTSAWGNSFIATSLATRTGGDIFKFLAKDNSTAVYVNGGLVATLNAGEQYETSLASNSYYKITSSNPILVGQFCKGSSADGVTSDPFFALVPPDDQFLTNYIISSGTSNIPNNYVNLTSLTSNTANVLVDGLAVAPGLWTAISGSTFSAARVPLTSGVHTISSVLPVGVLAYGYGSYDSYGYLGGQSFSPVATVSSFTLTLQNATALQAQTKCVEATVVDQNNNPVVGVKVDFTVIGANSAAGFGNTDANGDVTYCYNTCLSGLDTIVAMIAGLVDTVYVTVLPSSLTVTPASANVSAGVQQCVTATILDGSNVPVPNAVVNFQVTGDNPVAKTAINTNANGEAVFCYTPLLDGSDVIQVTAGCSNGNSQNVNVTVNSGGAACNLTTSITTKGVKPLYVAAGANDPSAYYPGLSATKPFEISVSGGTAPYSFVWSTTSGIIKSFKGGLKAGLIYPSAACWVKVTITDNGGNTCKDSLWVNYIDYTCPPQPGMLWWYQVCDLQTQTTVCVHQTSQLDLLLQTNNYVFGSCGPKTEFVLPDNDFVVYPNPNNGFSTLRYQADQFTKVTINVVDVNGRILYSENTEMAPGTSEYILDLNTLTNGIYFVQLHTEKEILTQKVQIHK